METALRTCSVCGGRLRSDNQTALCERTDSCRKAKARARYERDPSAQKARVAGWRSRNGSRIKTQRQQWKASNPDKVALYLKNFRVQRYGITLAQYDEMLAAQGGRCAICPATEPGGKGSWHIDHDHETEVVRGLLCHGCNLMLGQAHDTPSRLEAGAAYLRRHGAN